jgi:DNA-binding MarR family transcriptional regulator
MTQSQDTRQLSLDDVRDLIDACWAAKRITEMLPELPKNMKPRHVHVIDAIWNLNHQSQSQTPVARVSGVSAFLGVTAPSITKLVNELVGKGLVVKHASETDGRAVTLSLTEPAEEIRELYVHQFHEHLRGVLSGISAQDAATAVSTLQAMHRLMDSDRGGEWTTQVADTWPSHVEALMAESRPHTTERQ